MCRSGVKGKADHRDPFIQNILAFSPTKIPMTCPDQGWNDHVPYFDRTKIDSTWVIKLIVFQQLRSSEVQKNQVLTSFLTT